MSQLEENNEEKEWRERLRDAEFDPPIALWERIEEHLDQEEKKKRPLFIWWNSPMKWIAAASVAVLVLTGIWLLDDQNSNPSIQIAGTKSLPKNATSGSSAAISERTNDVPETENSGKQIALTDGNQSKKKAEETLSTSVKQSADKRLSKRSQRGNFARAEGGQNRLLTKAYHTGSQENQSGELHTDSDATHQYPALSKASSIAYAASTSSEQTNRSISVDYLDPLGVRTSDVYFQRRYIHFQPLQEKLEDPVVKPTSGTWLALNAAPGSFNPNLQPNNTAQAATYNYVLSQSSFSKANAISSHANEARFSYSVMAQAGKQVSKHWSVESGVSYLQGNSGYYSSGILKNLVSGQSQNSLDLALLTERNGQQYSSDNTAYVEVNQMVSNNYRFVQVPLQAGYTILPGSKLNYSLLAGMVTNIFLQNDFGSSSGQTNTITTGDDTYRQINWSGSTGLRISYRMSSQWNLNLTGSYQRSLLSNFKQNSTLKSHPEFFGLGWGLKYSF